MEVHAKIKVSTNAQGLVLNPCGVATNGLAMYKLDVVPAGIVPDNAIHWSIASGDVNFYQSYNTGRTAIIRGGNTADSDFKLEVTIDGLPTTYKPYILGRVLNPTNVQVRAYIICDTNGVAAVSNSTINAWIVEANRIYRQVAMTFTLESVNSVTNQDWFDIADQTEFYDMASYTNEVGGLELYCVNSIYGNTVGLSNPSSVSGARRGIAVKNGAAPMVFAHEAGHACWLDDIPVWMSDNSPITQEKAGSLNWSGGTDTGYYNPALSHMSLVRRLLLYGKDYDLSIDIPLGSVMSKMDEEPYLETSFAVGLRENMTRNPEH
jgi:hypothetical protein